jgi:hypothetical protein
MEEEPSESIFCPFGMIPGKDTLLMYFDLNDDIREASPQKYTELHAFSFLLKEHQRVFFPPTHTQAVVSSTNPCCILWGKRQEFLEPRFALPNGCVSLEIRGKDQK